jgi:hypothetical protein
MDTPGSEAPAAPPAEGTSPEAPKKGFDGLDVIEGDKGVKDPKKAQEPPKLGPDGKPIPPDPNKKVWKLNVYGKDVDFDASDEAQIQKAVQKGLAADKRFTAAAKSEKQLAALINSLRQDPLSVAMNEKLGHDPEVLLEAMLKKMGPKARKVAEKYMGGVVDYELMDPKDREILDHKKKIEEFEASEKEARNKQQAERFQRLQAQYHGEYEADIVSTLESSGLPKTPATVKRLAYYLDLGLRNGAVLKAADVIEYVKRDYQQETNDLYGATDGDLLLSILGKDVVNKVMSAATKAAKNGNLDPVPLNQQPSGDPNAPKKIKYISPDQWREKHGL